MFGINGNKQAPVAPQNASMLDNVNPQDLNDMSTPQHQSSQSLPVQPASAPAAMPPKPVGHPLAGAAAITPTPDLSSSGEQVSSSAPAVVSVSSSTPSTPTVVNDSSASDPVFTVGAVEAVTPEAPHVEASSSVNPTMDVSPSSPVAPPAISSVSAPAVAVSPAEPKPDVDKTKLEGMKQQALDHLEPLVEHLDQSPEEQFKTTMMMIQANDNHTLLDKALVAAKSITDDKARAQAMLDIINEINYFSQVAPQQGATS